MCLLTLMLCIFDTDFLRKYEQFWYQSMKHEPKNSNIVIYYYEAKTRKVPMRGFRNLNPNFRQELYNFIVQCLCVCVRMAEWSKALRSGRSPLLWAWVQIPLLTKTFIKNWY
jgi:hypothetical protein